MEFVWAVIGLGVIAAVYWVATRVVDHWYGSGLDKELQDVVDKAEEVVDAVVDDIQQVFQDLPSKDDLKKLTKTKLEELGREFNIELDKRKTKANMIEDLHKKAGK